jgi:hypothetical protein
MQQRSILCLIILLALPFHAAAVELILPVFALNADSPDGRTRSSEVYLVNPTPDPIQVTLDDFLPGRVHRPAPCDQFMSPTRVVPPRSAVLWTATGLATDLGCADEVLGALILRADGPVRISGRMVHGTGSESFPSAVLSGGGQPFTAVPIDSLPGPTTLLMPALLWHRNPCGEPAFRTSVGFANPGRDPVTVTVFLKGEGRRAMRVNGRIAALPYQIEVGAGRWRELRLDPVNRAEELCLDPESFDLELIIDGQLAVYGTVVDHRSGDARTVAPVDLEHD